MILDFTEFRRVIENYIKANYTETAIKYENVDLDTSDLDEFIAVFDKPSFAESTGMGETSSLTGGNLIIQIFTPLNTGTDRAREIADILATALDGEVISGVALSTPELHASPNSTEWYQTVLQIPYITVMGQESLC